MKPAPTEVPHTVKTQLNNHVIYCINPHCKQRQNPDGLECCQTCGTPLLIHDRYRLIQPLRRLDSRKYTDVFEVDDQGTRKVMKVLKDNHAKLVELFEREALTLELLNHPGIPQVESDGYFIVSVNSTTELHCLVLEKIEGQNLEAWAKQYGAISQALALNWLRQLLEIIDYLHQNQFFHRDIKPSNIILKPDGRLVLIDFGSVREITGTYLAKLRGDVELTKIISEGYTAPEQRQGRCLPQSDFYALGRTLVHLLTNKPPSCLPINHNTGQLIWQDKAPQISKPLAEFIDDLMADAVVNRPQDVKAIAQGLTRVSLWLRGLGCWVRSPHGIATIITLGIMGVGVYHISQPWRFQYYFKPGKEYLEQVREYYSQYYWQQGREALIEFRLEQARLNLERAVKINPNSAIARSDLGLICKYQEDFKCAKEQFNQALQLKPDAETAATIHYNLGILYEDDEKFDQALAEYKRAMQDNGYVGIDATNNFARLQIWRKVNYNLAINLLLKALQRTETLDLDETEKNSLQSVLYKNLGWAFRQKADYQEAEKYLQTAITLDETQAAPHCLLAQVQQKQGDDKNALISWKNCLEFESRGLPEVQTWQGEAQEYLNAQ
ncbi:protein kinase domain-containing protein [Coleofasciculus chthonoplastes]|uniref:protein kinase domain-containing protein n=1 Tax=Coleofasciculus chthonoplastes TaxID=64178 RepID=UPI0032FBE5F8